jgi:RNA polymerase sigma-70 factor (ECF subfamily)
MASPVLRPISTNEMVADGSAEPRMDRRELEAELEREHPHGFAWAVRCCGGNRADAEDVLHHAYLKVLDGRARFEGRSAFRTWLFGVIRYTAHDQTRSWWSHATRLGRWWREQPNHVADPSQVNDDPRVGRLREALANLSARQGEVLHLVFYQDLTIEDAAGVMGIPLGTARTHYERGKTRLRKLLASETMER